MQINTKDCDPLPVPEVTTPEPGRVIITGTEALMTSIPAIWAAQLPGVQSTSCDHLLLPHLQLPNLLNNSRPREVKLLVPGHPALWLGTSS